MRKLLLQQAVMAIAAVVAWEMIVRPFITAGAPARAESPLIADNAELTRLYKEDQDDRMPPAGQAIDWKVVGPRDREREARVKDLYREDRLQTGADYYHAAMVLQHAPAADDYLLAHEFCVAAIIQGEKRARWLAAASEDRFLMNLKRPQRFATQYRSDGPTGPMRLYDVDPAVTDRLRQVFGAPSLAEAKKREAEFNKK
jgi:hypothetical protein